MLSFKKSVTALLLLALTFFSLASLWPLTSAAQGRPLSLDVVRTDVAETDDTSADEKTEDLLPPVAPDAMIAAKLPKMPPKTLNAIPGILRFTWEGYKGHYIQADGRVLDPYEANISTSESQSYALLRAVWMHDQKTFDTVYRWTKDNLQVRGDALFAWKWGQNKGGEWKALDVSAASDADQDIALALLMADALWGQPEAPASETSEKPDKEKKDKEKEKEKEKTSADEHPSYKADALAILNDLWDKCTAETPIGKVLKPGDWKQEQDTLLLNPSYFSPAHYRVFQQADPNPAHAWAELAESSYWVIEHNIAKTRTGLPSNWLRLDVRPETPENERIVLYYDAKDERGDYGYDAIRVHWRVGLDHLLFPEKQEPLRVFTKTNFLHQYWVVNGTLPSPMTADGIVRPAENGEEPSVAIYGTPLMLLTLYQPPMPETQLGEAVIYKHVFRRLKPNGLWRQEKDYFGQNWVWFGLLTYEYYQRHDEHPPVDPIKRLVGMVE